MEFDVNNVYTSVNADELHKGDLVCVADNLDWLKTQVKETYDPMPIAVILSEDNEYRFRAGDKEEYEENFNLAYLVCPARNAEAYKAWKEGKCVKERFGLGNEDWTVRDPNRDNIPDYEWYYRDYRPVVEQPKEKKYRPFKDCKELCDFWYKKTAVNVPSYAMPLIWVKRKFANCTMLITAFNDDTTIAVAVGNIVIYTLAGLLEEFTFLDGTPCGVEVSE